MKKIFALSIITVACAFACNNEKKSEPPPQEEPAVVTSATPDSVSIITDKDSLVKSQRGAFIKNKKLNLRLSKDSISKLNRAEKQQ